MHKADAFLHIKDIVPALSGAIGKAALVSAFALAWANALQITAPGFVMENARLELMVSGVVTLLFSVLTRRDIPPVGTLAPLIPLIPAMALAGVHPLALALQVGVLGLLFARLGVFERLTRIGGNAVRAGMLLLLGVRGLLDAIRNLHHWSLNPAGNALPVENASSVWLISSLLVGGMLTTILLRVLKLGWLTVPAVGGMGLLLAALFGFTPAFSTLPGLPAIQPSLWWVDRWGLGFGLDGRTFLAALPYALLVLILWPIDTMSIQAMQSQTRNTKGATSRKQLNEAFFIMSIRNLTGALVGGAQTAALWRSFLIPLALVRRPLRGAALLLSLFVIGFAVAGTPIDVAVFPPLVWSVLLFGVFLPMCERGADMLRDAKQGPRNLSVAGMVAAIGLVAGPVLGWMAGLVTEGVRSAMIRRKRAQLPGALEDKAANNR